MKKLRYLLPLAALGLVLSSCGSDGVPLNYREGDLDINTEWVDYKIPPNGVVFSDKEQHLYLEKGTVYEYQEYYVSPRGATSTSLSWSSSDSSIASVEDGVVTAVSGGRAKIFVSESHQNFAPVELIVDVTNTIKDFTVHAPSGHEDLELDWNKQYQFTYDLEPADTTDTELIWSIPVEEQAYAKIDNRGLLTTYAVDALVHLTVKSPKLEKEVKFDLLIQDREIHVQSISLSIDNSRVEIGKTAQLSAEVTPSNADDAGDVKYLSSDPSIASVDVNTGLVTATSSGTVELWANADGVDSNHVELEVYEVYATALSIDKSSDYIVTNDEDGSRQLLVSVETSEIGNPKPTNAVVKYESNDPSVVSIDESGMMTAHKSGQAIITASIKGQGLNFYQDTVTVTAQAYITKVTITGATSAYITDPATPVVLTASVEPNPHEEDALIWTVNPEEKVEKVVDGNELTLTPLSAGPVTVTATSTHSGVSATHTISFNIKNADYTLAGDFNNWTAGDQAYALNKISDDPVHYQIKGINLVKGQGVKVVDELKTNWYSNASEYPGCGYTLVDDGFGGKNMSLDHSGEYTIDFYPNSEYANTIVFTLDVPGEDPVVEVNYYLVGEFNNWTQLDENYKFTQKTENHYRLEGVTLESGKAIKVMDDALPKHNWFTNASDDWEGCEYVLVDDGYGGKNIQVKEGGEYTIDFYVESEYGNHIIFHSGEVPPEPEYEHNWYLKGSITNWELDESLYFTKNPGDSNHYYIADVELEFGDEFKAYNPTTDTWLGTSGSGSWWTAGTEGDQKDNLIVSEAGTYTVNLYINDSEGHHLTLYKDQSIPEYTANITADLSVFDTWDKPVSKVSLYIWAADGSRLLGDWADCVDNLATGSVTLKATKAAIHFIFFLYQTIDDQEVLKQSVDLDCNIYESGDYVLDLSDIKWNDSGKMYNITLGAKGEDPVDYEHDWYLIQSSKDDQLDTEVYFSVDPKDANHLYIANIALVEGDAIKAYNPTTDEWLGTSGSGKWWSSDDMYNLVVGEDGTFHVNLYLDDAENHHLTLWKDTSIPEFSAKVSIDLSAFDSWDKPVSKVSLYVICEDGSKPLGEWADCEGNLDSGSVTITSTHQVTTFVLYLYQYEDMKQTVDLSCDLTESGDYKLDLSDIRWNDAGKMYNISIIPDGGDTPVSSKLTVTCDLSILDQKIGGSTSSYSIYAWCSDGTKIYGSYDNCYLNFISGTIEIDFPEGKTITGFVIYLWQGDAKKQSTNIEVNITEAGTYYVMLPDSLEWVEEDNQWKFKGITIEKAAE